MGKVIFDRWKFEKFWDDRVFMLFLQVYVFLYFEDFLLHIFFLWF
jgi:hypothetical protein